MTALPSSAFGEESDPRMLTENAKCWGVLEGLQSFRPGMTVLVAHGGEMSKLCRLFPKPLQQSEGYAQMLHNPSFPLQLEVDLFSLRNTEMKL